MASPTPGSGSEQDNYWPLPKFYFSVDIGDFTDLPFQEVSGLDISTEAVEYRHIFATAHSTGFYAKKELINFIGNYNTKFKCSSDYDFYMRMINANKFLGSSTTGNKIIGEVASGGYSSTLSFFDHLLEETKIRIKNKQNIFYIALIFINAIFKNYLNKIKIIYILISLIFIFLLFFT